MNNLGTDSPHYRDIPVGSNMAPSKSVVGPSSRLNKSVESAAKSGISASLKGTSNTSNRSVTKMNPRELKAGVAKVAQARELSALGKGMQRVTGKGDSPFQMASLGSSVNPVTRLKMEQFVPASVLPKVGSDVGKATANDGVKAFKSVMLGQLEKAQFTNAGLRVYITRLASQIDSGKNDFLKGYQNNPDQTAEDFELEFVEELSDMWPSLLTEEGPEVGVPGSDFDPDSISKTDRKALKEFFKGVGEEYRKVDVGAASAPASSDAASEGPERVSLTVEQFRNQTRSAAGTILSRVNNETQSLFNDFKKLLDDTKALGIAEGQIDPALPQKDQNAAAMKLSPQLAASYKKYNESLQVAKGFNLAMAGIEAELNEKASDTEEGGMKNAVASDIRDDLVAILDARKDNAAGFIANTAEGKRITFSPEVLSKVSSLVSEWKGHVENDLPTSVELKGVPQRYDKDGVLANLRLQGGDNALAAIRQISSEPDRYITIEVLDRIAKETGVDLGVMKKNLEPFYSSIDLERGSDFSEPLRAMIQMKMEAIAPSHSGASEKLATAGRPGYAFKLGLENHREILAGKVAQSLGLDAYYTMKTDANFEAAILAGTKAPSGIASKWLEDAAMLSGTATKLFFAMCSIAKAPTQWARDESRSVLMDRFEKFNATIPTTFVGWLSELKEATTQEAKDVASAKLQRLQRGVAELEKKGVAINPAIINMLAVAQKTPGNQLSKPGEDLPPLSDSELHKLLEDGWYDTCDKFVGPYQASIESSQALALSDALLLTNDGHEQQYMFKTSGDTTHIECIDQARLLSPSVCYTREGQTYIALRSTWLDSPTLDEPIPPRLQEQIKQMNAGGVAADLRNAQIVRSNDSLNQIREECVQINSNLDAIGPLDPDDKVGYGFKGSIKEDTVRALCGKYNISVPDNWVKALPQLRSKLMDDLKAKTAEMYQHVSEKSLAGLQERITLAQEYLASSVEPKTMRGLVEHTLPEVSTIANALALLNSRPYLSINIRDNNGVVCPTPLETTIKQLEVLCKQAEDKGESPPVDLAKVRTAVESLKAKQVDVGEVLQCMNSA